MLEFGFERKAKTTSFWGICDHKSLKINESAFLKVDERSVGKINSADEVSCGTQDMILMKG